MTALLALSALLAACQALLTLDNEKDVVGADASSAGDAIPPERDADANDASSDGAASDDASDVQVPDAAAIVIPCGQENTFCATFDTQPFDAGWSGQRLVDGVYSRVPLDGGAYLEARATNVGTATYHQAHLYFEFPSFPGAGKDVTIVLRGRVRCPFDIEKTTHVLGVQLKVPTSIENPPITAYAVCRRGSDAGLARLQLITQNQILNVPNAKDLTTDLVSSDWMPLTLIVNVRAQWAPGEQPGSATLTIDGTEKATTNLYRVDTAGKPSAMKVEIQAGIQYADDQGTPQIVDVDDVQAGVF